jgi:hypothetical protein
MEWIIIMLLIIFVIVFFTLKPDRMILMNKPQTQTVQCYEDSSIKDLVMLPKLNPAQLTTHTNV